jgi:hypothetical protein
MINPRIDIEKDKPQKSPLLWREGMKGRGIKKVITHPHPSPLPSRERGNWFESMSFFPITHFIDSRAKKW